MMHTPAVIAVAVLVEIIAAFPHASALKAPTFLAVEDAAVLLAAELRQPPETALKTKKTPTTWGLFVCSIFGSFLGYFGVTMMYSEIRSRREAALMAGDDVVEATATITSRRKYTSETSDGDGGTKTQHHYEACYWFEAVRVDGMRCRITVTDRELGSEKVWECCPEGSRQQVNYLGDDPQHCRLTQAADNDKMSADSCCGLLSLGMSMLFGLFLAAIGFLMLSAALLAHAFANGYGLLGFLVSAPIWFGLVCYCMLSEFTSMDSKFTRVKDTSLEKLGMQEPSSKLGNISGTWSLQSDMGTFEYKFAMENECKSASTHFVTDRYSGERIASTTGNTTTAFSLIVQGRPEGKEWDPEYQAHFTDGKTMNWQDNQGTAFTVTFEDAQKFGGCAKATNGSELAFVGFRQK